MERYHDIVHKIALLFSYQYDESAPDWFHPVLHFVIFVSPFLLLIVVLRVLTKGIVKYVRRKTKTPKFFYDGYIRGEMPLDL